MKSKSSKSVSRTGIVSVLFAMFVAFSALSVSVNADERQKADQKRSQEMLDIVSEQVNRHMYDAALSTIAGIEATEDLVLNDKQSGQLAVFKGESEAGVSAQSEAVRRFAALEGFLADEDYAGAESELNALRALSGYLTEDMAKGLKSAQGSVAALQKSLKGRMKNLFAQSKGYYKQGQYNEARIGFETVSSSGIELTFMDRGGDFGTAETYLAKIDEKESAGAMGSVAAEIDTEPSVDLAKEVARAQEEELTQENINEETELVAAVEPEPQVSVASEVSTPTVSGSEVAVKSNNKKSWWSLGLGSSKLSEAQAQQVERLLAYGDLAMSKKKYEQAREYFKEALAINPENETAQKFLTVAEYHISRPVNTEDSAKLSIIEKVKQRQALQVQAVKSNWVNTRERTSVLVAEGKYAAALSEIVQALASIESNRQLLGDEVYVSLKSEAEGLRAQVEQYRNEAEARGQEEKIRTAATLQKQIADKVERERQENIDNLFSIANQFAEKRRFQNAIDTMDRVLTIDPNNETAKYLRNSYEQFLLWQRQHEAARQADKNVVQLLIEADESLTPPTGKVNYPDAAEWREKSKRMPKPSAVAGSKTATMERMRTVRIPVEFDDVSLSEALDIIAAQGEVVVLPMWPELDLAGITPDDLVTVRSSTMSIGKALDFVLNYVSAGTMGKAGYKVDEEGNVVIKVVGDDYGYEFRTYYIGDLVRPTYSGGGMGGGMMGGMGGGMMGGMGGGMMGGMGGMGGMMGGMGGGMMGGMGGMGGMMGGMGGGMGGGYGFDRMNDGTNGKKGVKGQDKTDKTDLINLGYTEGQDENWHNTAIGGNSNSGNNSSSGNNNSNNSNSNSSFGNSNSSRGGVSNYMQVMELNQLLMQSISPNSWRFGMGTNRMNATGNRGGLDGQDDAAQLNQRGFGQIIPFRNIYFNIYQTPEVHQEIADFLASLRAMFGDQVSLETRLLTINNNMLEDIGVDVDFLLNASEHGWDKWGDIEVEQQHAEWASPSASTGMTGSLGGGAVPTAFQMSGSFLDNIQVDFLIRATKANSRSRMLTAPHVTVFNGENAYVNFSRQFVYVSEMDPEAGVGVVGYDVETDTLTSGIEMNLTPYITFDKRYVVMNIDFSQEILDSMFDFSYVSTENSTVDQVDGTDIPNQGDMTVRIQLPQTSVTQVDTKVSVPDGGTLLLGGQKLVGEVEQESGVPGLAHIPVLNRLFSTRNKTKDENIVLVLIKPKIIIQSEMEEDNFGSLELDQNY